MTLKGGGHYPDRIVFRGEKGKEWKTKKEPKRI